MAVATSTLLAAGAVASAVGTGVSIYSSNQQAAAQEKAAAYNAAVQRNNAVLRRAQIENQAIQDKAIAENQVAYQNCAVQVQKNNAISLRQRAVAEEETARENIRRERQRKARALANIRASAAGQGLNVGEGAVVEALAETSGILEMDILEIGRTAQQQMNNLYYQAELEEAGVNRTQAEAGITQLRADNAEYNFGTGRYAEMFGKSQAELTLLSGANAASQSRMRGAASAISGVGDITASYLNYQDKFKPKSSGALRT